MARIIITDSTVNIPPAYLENYDIRVVSLNVHIGDLVYQEGIDLDHRDFYSRLRQEPIFPRTSQPASGEFLRVFNSLQPGDEALVILISSQLSGTVHSAQVAAKIFNNDDVSIRVVDSKTTTSGLGYQVIKACELSQAGVGIDNIISELERLQDHHYIYFVVGNLEYLARGGRISQVSKYIGNILQVKPILYLKNGKIELFEKQRTSAKAVNRILEVLHNDIDRLEYLSVLNVDAPQEGRRLLEQAQQLYSEEIFFTETTPVIGSHVGPGTVGIVYYYR